MVRQPAIGKEEARIPLGIRYGTSRDGFEDFGREMSLKLIMLTIKLLKVLF